MERPTVAIAAKVMLKFDKVERLRELGQNR